MPSSSQPPLPDLWDNPRQSLVAISCVREQYKQLLINCHGDQKTIVSRWNAKIPSAGVKLPSDLVLIAKFPKLV